MIDSSTAKPSNALFDEKANRLNLLVPFFFLSLSIIEIVIGRNPLDRFLNYQQQTYFFFTFFLSTTHVALTPAMVYLMPEVKELDSEQRKLNLMGIRKKVLIFFTLAFVLVSAIEFINFKQLATALFVLLSFGNLWHFVAQSFGVSLFYLAQGAPQALDKLRTKLKLLNYILLLITFGFQMAIQLTSIGNQSYFTELRMLALIAQLVCIFASIWLFQKYLSNNKGLLRNKIIYTARLLLFPLSLFSLTAGLAVAAIHPIEYLLIYKKLSVNTRMKKNEKVSFNLLWALFAILNLTAYTVVWSQHGQGQLFYIVASAFFAAMTFTHFYSDRLLFKMKDPGVPAMIKKLTI